MKILLTRWGDGMPRPDIETKILNKISDNAVFDVELSEDKVLLNFCEACDYHFEINLNKKEVVQLIAELQTIADKMID